MLQQLPERMQDITGIVFGNLTVLRYDGKQGKVPYWLCRCKCGSDWAPEISGPLLEAA